MDENEQIVCDSCKSEIPADSKRCPVCGAELGTNEEENRKNESLDDVMNYIIGEEDDEELLNKIKSFGAESKDGISAEEFNETLEEYEEEVTFECPVCNAVVSADDSECPNCGAVFAVEEEYDAEVIEKLENEIENIKSELDHLGDSGIDLTYIHNGLNDLIDSYEEGREEEALDILDILNNQIDDVKRIKDILETSKRDMKNISEKTDIKPFEKRIDHIVEKSEVGEYKSALKEATDLEEELDRAKSKFVEDEAEREEFERKIKEARKNLAKVRSSKIDISDLKEFMKEAVSAKKQGEFSEGILKAEKVIGRANAIIKIVDLIEEGKDRIRDMKKKGIQYNSYLEKMKEGKSKSDDNDYQIAQEILKEVMNEMDERLKQYEEEEKELIESKKELFDEYEEIHERAEENLKEAKETKLSVKPIQKALREAEELKKERKIESAIENIKNADRYCEDLLKVNDQIYDAKSKLKKLKEQNIEYKGLLKRLKRAKKMADAGEYNRSFDEIDKIFEDVEEKERKEELKEEIEDLISEVDITVEKAENLNVEIEKALHKKESALNKKDEGLLEDSKKHLEETIEIVHTSIEDKIEEELMELELNLEDSWNEDATQDAEELIEDIRNLIEERTYDEIPEILADAREKTEEALGPISNLHEKISDIDDLIFEIKILEYDISDAEEDIEDAKEELELGDWEAADNLVKSAEEKIANKIPKLLEPEIKDARDELREAKIKGIDISEAVNHLREVKIAQKEDELMRAFEEYKQFKAQMKEIRKQY